MKPNNQKLSQIKLNEANPRSITDAQFDRLIGSLLVFPKMLALRPIVIDKHGVVLGGNMRYRALSAIAQMKVDEIGDRLRKQQTFTSKSQAEQEALVQYWAAWQDAPTVEVVSASDLTDAEVQEFVIKDNAAFGQWDFDMLANAWDTKCLSEWGVDVWQPLSATQAGNTNSNLPPEIAGKDLEPDDLPKMEGDDKTAMQRIIVCYTEAQAETLAKMLGLPQIEKIVYTLDEILEAK